MYLGVIPARGGSKGVPRKNIKTVAGFPLVYWSIQAAKKSKLLGDFYVSTEDEEIAEIASGYGAKVIKRPLGLAEDTSTTLDVVKHAAELVPCSAVVVLHPTSPIRNFDTIDNCIKKYESGDYDTLVTGYLAKMLEYGSHHNLPRQKIKGFFYDDGNVYILDNKVVLNNRWSGDKICRVELEKALRYEIDDPEDLFIVEALLNKRLESGVQVS